MTALVSAAPGAQSPIRVMIVDDSAVVRGMVSRWLEEESDIAVVAFAVDGEQALKKARETEIDVCILDIEMPVMSGLEALPRLLALRPGLKVIMASTLSERGAEITLRALNLGAADYIPKPTASRAGARDDYHRELIEKVRQFRARISAAPRRAPPPPPSPATGHIPSSRPEALVIASSTGGPPALRQVMAGLGAAWRAPVLIAQHMPAGFTRTLAAMLDKTCVLEIAEAIDGEPVVPGRGYVAPGGRHMALRRLATGAVAITLNDGPEINWCRPSADPLLSTAAEVWGAKALGLVLTGMGHDGRDGARILAARGGRILAQDEASSVVWGMPGAVVEAGLAERVLPLAEIGPFIARLGGRS